MKKLSSIILFILLNYLSLYVCSCKDDVSTFKNKIDEIAIVSFVSSKGVSIVRSGKKKPLKIKEILKVKDTIITDKKSFALLQIASSIVLKISANTTVKLENLLKKKQINLNLVQGKISANVEKLKKNQSFSISTLSCIAAVRGTLFSIDYNKTKTTIPLAEGKLFIITKENKKRFFLNKGKTATIFSTAANLKNKVEISNISKNDIGELKTIESLKADRDILKRSPYQIKKSLQNIVDKINKLSQNKKMKNSLYQSKAKSIPKSIEEIKASYNHIDRITLYNGKVILGAIIINENNTITILIPQGKIKIQKSNIKKQEIIK